MLKKFTVVLFLILFFSIFNLARADVVINEVQLSPTAERFIELYNTSAEDVDLTGWFIQRKTATGTAFGSLVSKPNFAGKIIDGHGFFVISKDSLGDSDIVLGTLTLTEDNVIQI